MLLGFTVFSLFFNYVFTLFFHFRQNETTFNIYLFLIDTNNLTLSHHSIEIAAIVVFLFFPISENVINILSDIY